MDIDPEKTDYALGICISFIYCIFFLKSLSELNTLYMVKLDTNNYENSAHVQLVQYTT